VFSDSVIQFLADQRLRRPATAGTFPLECGGSTPLSHPALTNKKTSHR
jgi:hypothetical protein